MPNGLKNVAKVLLKCRATDLQLKDRIRQPFPNGIEIYLDIADIDGKNWSELFIDRLNTVPKPEEFEYIVEGPLRSLDGSFFDLSNGNPVHEEVMRRVLSLGREIGAKAAVLHCISARDSIITWNDENKRQDLEKAGVFLEKYVQICKESGMIPTIENVPPVARMREERFLYSSIGVEASDLVWLTDRVSGLKVTLDVSHAQLYINAANSYPTDATEELAPLIAYYHKRPDVSSIEEYVSKLSHVIANVHVSNASGLLAEGLPYKHGDMDLDSVIARLATLSSYIVTETIEPDADNAVLMREAQDRINATIRTLEKRNKVC